MNTGLKLFNCRYNIQMNKKFWEDLIS